MKNITVSVDDELSYDAARVEAAKRRKSLSALVREFMVGLQSSAQSEKKAVDPELAKLWAMSDRKHAHRRGSVGPLNREALYQRGIPRH